MAPQFNITKTHVQAQTRQLSATWTLDYSQALQRKYHKPPRSKEILMRLQMLQTHGFCIPVFDKATEAKEWCMENVSPDWDTSYHSELITKQDFEREMAGEPQIHDDNSVEDMLSNALAREIEQEINDEIFRDLGMDPPPRPVAWFWFTKRLDAIRFRLTWGN